jgi:hypothetical protein
VLDVSYSIPGKGALTRMFGFYVETGDPVLPRSSRDPTLRIYRRLVDHSIYEMVTHGLKVLGFGNCRQIAGPIFVLLHTEHIAIAFRCEETGKFAKSNISQL